VGQYIKQQAGTAAGAVAGAAAEQTGNNMLTSLFSVGNNSGHSSTGVGALAALAGVELQQ